jgi:hypothetical protein
LDNGYSEQTLVSLAAGEPTATLFEVPASYAEVPPSRLLKVKSPEMASAVDSFYRAHGLH